MKPEQVSKKLLEIAATLQSIDEAITTIPECQGWRMRLMHKIVICEEKLRQVGHRVDGIRESGSD